MQMTWEYIEEFDVIRRYHQHRLTDEELNSFEIYILENPDIINVIEQEKIIHDAFHENKSLLKEAAPAKQGDARMRVFAMAACLLIAVVVVFNYSGSGTTYSLQPPVILETFRGAGDNVVTLSGAPIVQFQIDMGPAEFLTSNAFTAELLDADGNVSFRVTGLAADAEGWLIYPLAEQQAALSGVYTVNVYPDGNPGQASTYPVQFTSP